MKLQATRKNNSTMFLQILFFLQFSLNLLRRKGNFCEHKLYFVILEYGLPNKGDGTHFLFMTQKQVTVFPSGPGSVFL